MSQEEIKTEEVQVKKSGLNLPTAIVFSAIIIAGAILARGNSSNASIKPDKLDLIGEITPEDHIRGNKNAEITVIEYADFFCVHCAEYHPTLKKLVEESNGKIRWVYRNLSILDPRASVAGECVAKFSGEEAFWKFADAMFATKHENLGADFYKETSVSLGVSSEDYDRCSTDPVLKRQIIGEKDRLKILLGFEATPTTVVIDGLGRKFSFSGALAYGNLKGVLDSLIK